MEAVETKVVTPEQLQGMIADEKEFTKFFKKEAFDVALGKGHWKPDGKRGHRLTLPDGSHIRVKFFNTIKEIYNSKNAPVPGRESFYSYIDVVVMPRGVKGYTFTTDVSQIVQSAIVKGKPAPRAQHEEAIQKLFIKGTALGIDLNAEGSWETYFVR